VLRRDGGDVARSERLTSILAGREGRRDAGLGGEGYTRWAKSWMVEGIRWLMMREPGRGGADGDEVGVRSRNELRLSNAFSRVSQRPSSLSAATKRNTNPHAGKTRRR
jgi:hypothetical protein